MVATGGMAPLIQSETSIFDAVNLDLTLVGLRLIYDMNAKAAGMEGKHDNPLRDSNIILGVTGSIACYKAADLAAKLAPGGRSR